MQRYYLFVSPPYDTAREVVRIFLGYGYKNSKSTFNVVSKGIDIFVTEGVQEGCRVVTTDVSDEATLRRIVATIDGKKLRLEKILDNRMKNIPIPEDQRVA